MKTFLNSDVLQEIFEATLHGSELEYCSQAISRLQARIGFDGAILGCGNRLADSAIAITHAYIDGKPADIVINYPKIAKVDPVSRKFVKSPGTLQNVIVRQYYSGQHWTILPFNGQYRARQMMICGLENGANHTLEWINLYREDVQRPFAIEHEEYVSSAVFSILLARRLRQAILDRERATERIAAAPKMEYALLTPREREVALSYSNGVCYKTVAKELGISPATVRCHLLSIFRKLDVHNKVELCRLLLHSKL